ncbi:MAG: hypothetical protein OXU45_02470 [Candidatus Melainabacteria bacterium]|nr:hypothetical protein [Candidatus Melainabacteria bacterium]
MSKKDDRTLERLFSHPMPMNLEWNEVKHMLEKLGASVETTHHSHTKITIGNETKTFKTFHKMLEDKHEVKELQHLLEAAGLAPSA